MQMKKNFTQKLLKKQNGAKTSLKLIKNSVRVANFCADVIGDICGVLSGAISALISMKITETFGLNFNIQFILSATVAALTVGGKALGKGFAKRNAEKIINILGKILSRFNIGDKKVKEKNNENTSNR